jgi:YVTN family beta-propeller protein
VIAAVFLSRSGPAIARADTLVRINTGDNRATGAVALGAQPTAVTVCAGSIWVTRAGGTVSEIDPATLAVHTVRVEGRPTDVADVGALAAVVSGRPERVTMIDAAFGQISNSFVISPSAASATAVAFGRDVWVANPTAGTLERLDPPYTGIAGTVRLSGVPRLVAAGEGAVWVVGGKTLWKMDAGVQRVVARSRLPFAAQGVAAGNGGVWLVDRRGGTIARVDPATARVVKRIRVGRAPAAVATGQGAVWVANNGDGTVSKIDPSRNSVVKTIRTGSEPIDLVAGLGAVWVLRRTH